MELSGCTNDHQLIEYKKSSGGGMSGGSDSTEICIIDDVVYLTDSHSDWYYEEPAVIEYLVDSGILSEIQTIFDRSGMKRWHKKKFTGLFVCDGKTTSYSFVFDDGEEVSFSSQIYPKRYSDILSQIEEIIDQYRKSGVIQNENPGQ